jgi:hypothetical protein
MDRLKLFILGLILLGCIAVPLTVHGAPKNHLGDIESPNFSPGAGYLQLHLNDDIKLSFGNTSASPDAYFEWDTAAATDRFELHVPAASNVLCLVDDNGTPRSGCIATDNNNAITIRNGADSAAGNLYVSNLYGTAAVQAGSANGFQWSGSKSKVESSADGIFELTNNAETQGLRLDLTVDSNVDFTDESGAALGNVDFITALVRVGGVWSETETLDLYTGAKGSAVATQNVALYSGAQSNAGDYASGDIDIYSGATTTDGNSGTITIYSGAAGAGAADAGDIVLGVNGDTGTGTTALTVNGADGTLTFKDYTRHHDVAIGAAIVGAAAPGQETIGTFRCYVFDANADLAYISVEIPSEWDAASDMAIDLLIFTDDGDALGNGEIIEFDLVYRSVDEGEAYDNGSAVTINANVTGGASETDKGQYKITATVDYDHADQPLAVEDTLGFSIMRDVTTSDTYSGDVHVCRAQLVYTANSLATH